MKTPGLFPVERAGLKKGASPAGERVIADRAGSIRAGGLPSCHAGLLFGRSKSSAASSREPPRRGLWLRSGLLRPGAVG